MCKNLIDTLQPCLVAAGIDPDLATLIGLMIATFAIALLPLVLVILFIWLERKISARMQDRIGPNRVGPYGILQNVADAVKLILKEDTTPAGADRLLYNAAPILAVMSVVAMWTVIPFTPVHVAADLEIGLLFVVAAGSVGTLGIIFAGWSSNNKYALLGAFRAVAQLISYEVPLALSLLPPIMLAGSLRLTQITDAQTGMWFIVLMPVSALIFLISNQAEAGRAPFDLIEADSEIVAGYNIEYSGMKFGIFMATEFLHPFTSALLFTVVFLGGWNGPFTFDVPLIGFVWLMFKALAVYIVMLAARFALPRLRIDQMMNFNWKLLIPVSVVNVLLMAFLLRLVESLGFSPQNAGDFAANVPQAALLFAGNLLLAFVVLDAIRRQGRRTRMSDSGAYLPVARSIERQPAKDELSTRTGR